jgi:peptidylprolyl isomerase
MRKKMIVTIFLTTLLLLPLCGVTAETETEAIPEVQVIDYGRLSETLGHLIVRQLDQAGFPFNLEKVVQGIRDEREGKPSPMSEEEYEQVVSTLQEQHFLQTAEQNLAEADAFLKDNALKEGIQMIDPKLHYAISQEGVGEMVGPESVPLIHYKGQLLDGTIFASSESIGEPIALPVKQSIPGIAKGVVGMKEGEKRVLYIHPELAYGLSGHLPPNSLLIFEVEIVKAHTSAFDAITQNVKESPQESVQ